MKISPLSNYQASYKLAHNCFSVEQSLTKGLRLLSLLSLSSFFNFTFQYTGLRSEQGFHSSLLNDHEKDIFLLVYI